MQYDDLRNSIFENAPAGMELTNDGVKLVVGETLEAVGEWIGHTAADHQDNPVVVAVLNILSTNLKANLND